MCFQGCICLKESCLHLCLCTCTCVCTAASNGLQACLISLSPDVFIVDLCQSNMKVSECDKRLLRGSNIRKNKEMGTILNQKRKLSCVFHGLCTHFTFAAVILKSRGGSLLLDFYLFYFNHRNISPDPHSTFVLYDSLIPGRRAVP